MFSLNAEHLKGRLESFARPTNFSKTLDLEIFI